MLNLLNLWETIKKLYWSFIIHFPFQNNLVFTYRNQYLISCLKTTLLYPLPCNSYFGEVHYFAIRSWKRFEENRKVTIVQFIIFAAVHSSFSFHLCYFFTNQGIISRINQLRIEYFIQKEGYFRIVFILKQSFIFLF